MKVPEIVPFLKANVEPFPDSIYRLRYRAAVRLTDGTYLPCVVFQGSSKQVNLALSRFEEELKNGTDAYRRIVELFITAESRLTSHDILSVERSPYAWPLGTLKTIHGETIMSWTAFVVEMMDGRMFSYGTTFSFEFFDLPDGYTFNEIQSIHSGMIYSDEEGMRPFTLEAHDSIKYLRERPFFTCYVDGIDG